MIFSKNNKWKKDKDTKKSNKKMETSKKLAWFSGICFAVAVMYSVLIFAYGIIVGAMCDFALPITLITVTGAVFGVTMVAYNSKSRYENVTKIQKDFLREKYSILKDIGVLDYNRAVMEIEEEFTEIEVNADNEKTMANQEITYNG
jgi:hypothetical protein